MRFARLPTKRSSRCPASTRRSYARCAPNFLRHRVRIDFFPPRAEQVEIFRLPMTEQEGKAGTTNDADGRRSALRGERHCLEKAIEPKSFRHVRPLARGAG